MLSSIDAVCARTPSCAAYGVPTSTLLRAGARPGAHAPVDGSRATTRTASGTGSSSTAPALVGVAFGATYGPALVPRAAGRAAVRAAPVTGSRCSGWSQRRTTSRATPATRVDYSEGLDAAVSCHDYPQLYDMTAPPAQRQREYRAAVRAEAHDRPGRLRAVHGAGVPGLGVGGAGLVPALAGRRRPGTRPDRRMPLGGHYPDVPVLVLSGELDSITTPAEGALVTAQFPRRRPGARREQLPRHRRRRHRRLRRRGPARVRARPRPRHHAAGARLHHRRSRRCGRSRSSRPRTARVAAGDSRRGQPGRGGGPSRRADRDADRRRRPGPLVEQLRRQRRRPVRRPLVLQRRPTSRRSSSTACG